MGNHEYDDLLEIQRPKLRRPPMSMHDRAAQFAPFAALTGYDEVVADVEKQREALEKELASGSGDEMLSN